ncbi:hypothetical protein BLNAU_14479 [Blattamonas nauphoetae]|uniref:Uncharacterized protein n=1 Tax=Blattamonas nauphoetae TaxID=2049346 RepID=A0ABQ9XDN1_9EUKA|nr:hypothetical protein BLNAU_14479 [Blattamonas nauphoetae]
MNDAMCMLKVSNSSLMVRDSEIISNIDQSPFVISMSNHQQSTSIQIISCSHHSKSSDLLPLVDVSRNPEFPEIDLSTAETNAKHSEGGNVNRFGGDSICVVGSSLNFRGVHLPIGSGPLFSFGMQYKERSNIDVANTRINTILASSSLLNVTSNRTPHFENQNRFGSVMGQGIVGCCVSRCSNHDSGTTMLDANLGGNLACLNTSFSSCIRESNTPASYTTQNYTTDQRFAFRETATITSLTFTFCTFREMSNAFGSSDGGSAIFINNAAMTLTISQCSFHICNVTATNDDGGAVFVHCHLQPQNTVEITKSSFTECKTIGEESNYGGSVQSWTKVVGRKNDKLWSDDLGKEFDAETTHLVSIADSFFEKGEALWDSAVAVYNSSTAAISNCSFVECAAVGRGAIGLYHNITISTMAFLSFRGCVAHSEPSPKDILIYSLTFADVSSKISHCDSTSGPSNVYFEPTQSYDSTLVPQITSTPTVEACIVTISGDEASVEARTKEVIGGAMGILLEGCLVPRLVFVSFDRNGENSSIGTATVSSGADGVLPSAEYTLRSFVLPGDVGSQLFSASAILKDANTTTITVKGVALEQGSYSMLVQSNGVLINISLTRGDSMTLAGDAPLYPSEAEGRLDWSTEYEIIRVEHEKDGTKNDIRRTNTLTFTTPSEQVRIAAVLSRSLNGPKDELSVVFSGFLLSTGTGRIQIKSLDSDAEFECDLSITDSTTCSIAFPVGWEENTTHLLFGKTYSVQSASCKSVPIVIDSGVSFVVPSPPVITSFSVPIECSSDSFSVSVVGSNFPSGGTYTVSLSSSRSFEMTFSTGTSGAGTVKAGLPSEIQFNTTYSIVSVTKGGEHVLLNQTSVTTPLGPILEKVDAALNMSNKNNVLLTLTGSRMMAGVHTLTFVDQGQSTPMSISVSINSVTSGSVEEVVYGGSKLKYGKRYFVSSLTSNTLHFALNGSVSFLIPDEPVRIVGIWGELASDGNSTLITLRGRQIAEGSYNVRLNSADGPSFVVSFDDEMSEERNSSVVSVSIFGSSPLLSFDTTYTLFSVAPTSSPSAYLIIDAKPKSFSNAEPSRLIGIDVSAFSTAQKDSVTLTVSGRALKAKTTYTLSVRGEPISTSSQWNADAHTTTLSVVSTASSPSESASCAVVLYPLSSADLRYGYLYSIEWMKEGSAKLLQNAALSFETPLEPARVTSAFPVLSINLQTVTVSLWTCLPSRLLHSSTPTTATRISTEKLELTLSLLTGSPSIQFGDEIRILSLMNDTTDVILDCSTIVIPHPAEVLSAESHFVHSLNTTVTIELTGTDLPLHTPFLVTLDSGDTFDITFNSTVKGSTTEMAIGWSDTLQFSQTYRIVSIKNEDTNQVVFVGDSVSFSTDPAPLPIIVFCDSSSSDSSRLCGTSEKACRSMDSAWKVGAMTGSLDVSIRIKVRATLSNTISCLGNGIVVVEKGTSIEPKLRIASSALMGENGMIVVSSDGLFELRDVDVLIESTLPSFVFLFASNSTIVIKDGSFVGPSDSTTTTHNYYTESDSNDSSVCSWTTGIVQLDNCSTTIDFTKFLNLSQGAINMKSGTMSIQTSAFSENTPHRDFSSSARRNIHCSDEGQITVGTLGGGDGTSTDPSPWVSAKECKLTGVAAVVAHPLFVPSLESGSKSSLNKKDKSFTITISGASLFPCDLSLEVFEVQKNKAEGQSNHFDLTKDSTTSFSESEITLILPQSELSLESSLEWRGRLVFGNGARTTSSFVIQQNTAERFAQSVKDNMKWWIPLAVALSAAVLVLILIVVCCRRRRTKTKEDKLLAPKTSEMDALPPVKIEIAEDWNSRDLRNVLIVGDEAGGPFTHPSSGSAGERNGKGDETKQAVAAECGVEGIIVLDGEAIQMKPVNRKDTLYSRLHSTPKIPFPKLGTAKQIAHALTEIQKWNADFHLLSRLSSHVVLFDSDGNVELKLAPETGDHQANLIKGVPSGHSKPKRGLLNTASTLK